MTWYLLLTLMLLMHIIEDFHVQGRMADMKQRSFWEPYGEMYGNDHKVVLLLHGFEWAVFVSIPLFLFADVHWSYFAVMVSMAVCHAMIDDAKCNGRTLNLVEDQTAHVMQVIVMLAAGTVTA